MKPKVNKEDYTHKVKNWIMKKPNNHNQQNKLIP